MKIDESSEQPTEGDVEALRTLLEQRYQNALAILRKKLNQAIDLAMVEMQLRQAHGENWEALADIPKVPIEQINLYCSFCGKSQTEVAKLIAGPTVYICNECVSICNEIIEDDKIKPRANE